MALSEYEQRELDEIERSLHGDALGWATILDSVVRRHRMSVAALTFVGGLVALGGAVTALSLPVLGVVISVTGFVAMGVGVGLFMSGSAPHPTLRRGAAAWLLLRR